MADPKTKMYADKDANGRSSNEIEGEIASADEMLAALGYTSEMKRSRSTWQVAFMSFVLASVPYGLSTTLYYPLVGGGPVAVIWGWVAVCLIILCVAISLGEITSVYPTAGGVYYQTYMLSPPSCRRVMAWICGWSYTLGNITITLAVNFGTTLFLIGCINIFTDADGNGIWPATQWQTWLVFVAITLMCNAISSLGNKYLPILDTLAIYWTFSGVIAIIVCVLAVARQGRHTASYAFGYFEASSGWTPGWSYCIGLLHAAYATSATGMILTICEEVQQPATQVPKAMVGTIVLNAICGFIFMVPLMFVLPDLAATINAPNAQPVPYILSQAIGNQAGAFCLTIPIIVLGVFCGVGCTTASSRCTWAFSRDGALPGSRWWKQVSPRLDMPFNAMMLCMVIELLLGLIYFGGTGAFNAFSGCGVIFLTLSYVMPIIASVFGGRKALKMGVYDFKAFGWFCNAVAIGWTFLVIPLFSMPSFIPTTPQTMNYASVVFAAGVLFSAAWYIIWGRRNYVGPPAQEEEVARRRSSIIVDTSHHHHHHHHHSN